MKEIFIARHFPQIATLCAFLASIIYKRLKETKGKLLLSSLLSRMSGIYGLDNFTE